MARIKAELKLNNEVDISGAMLLIKGLNNF